jgi:purine-binding chemotaxis protein CheW
MEMVKTAYEQLQLVTFILDEGEYAMDIRHIQEVNRLTQITTMPMALDHVEGVINLRGRIVPVVNLRKKFGLESKIDPEHSRVIVVDAGVVVGMIVDAVSEVLRISSELIEPVPDIAAGDSPAYLTGIVKLPDRLISLLDAGELVGRVDTKLLELTSD